MSFYDRLEGGYLTPAYEIRPSENWLAATGTTGAAGLSVSPKYQGTHALGIVSATAGSTVVSSAMPVDLTLYDGIGLTTYASAGSPLIVVTARLLQDPAGADTVADVVFDHPFDHVAPATVGGEDCIRLRLTGVAPATIEATPGAEAVIHGSALGFDRTFIVEDVTAGPTASDTYVFVQAGGVTVTSQSTTGRVRIYGDDAVYFRASWAVTPDTASSGLFTYGNALYNVALYGFDASVGLDAWNLVRVPVTDLAEINSPDWGSIQQVDLECLFDGPGTFYLDGIAGWVREDVEAASANQLVSNLPEYHHFQSFTDAFAQAAGYDLDLVSASVVTGLRQRLLPEATYDLDLHEQALSLPQAPLLRSAEQRRNEMLGYLSMPATVAEMAAALTRVMGSTVTLTENFDHLSVDVTHPTADATAQARLKRACGRLMPAHLGITYNFTGATLTYATREGGELNDTDATVT